MVRPEINFINRTGKPLPVSRRAWRALYRRVGGEKNLSLIFITSAEARRLNWIYRGKQTAANVLTFPSAAPDEAGDIFICPAAARSGRKQQELFVHALLHLAGFNHRTRRAEAAMNAAAKKILS